MKPFRMLWLVMLLAACSRTVPKVELQEGSEPLRTAPWDAQVTASLAELPLQHDGRIKSLANLASYTLYRVHGRRDVKMRWPGDPERTEVLTPVEWFLDVLCFPDQAADYPLFRIENVEVFDAIGIAHAGGQRFDFDYLSYRQALGAARKLGELADQYRSIESSDRSPLQAHIVALYDNVVTYHMLHTDVLMMARSPIALQGEELRKLFGGRDQVGIGELLRRGPELRALLARYTGNMEAEAIGNGFLVMQALMTEMERDVDPALFPAREPGEHARWLSIGKVVSNGMDGALAPEHQAMLDQLHTALSVKDQQQAGAALLAFAQQSVALAARRGEASKPALEAGYLTRALHYQALHWFLFGFLLVALHGLMPRRWTWALAMAVNGLSWCLLSADIVWRCLITGRPPILSLYDTFLFIAAVGVLVALVIEAIQRRGLVLWLASVLGALLIMLARLYELQAGDTFREIQAVLRSNFWLATHVTTINIGYGAGLVASLLGTAWLVMTAFFVRRNDPRAATLHRATYGATCFGLLFAVVGTILGGVWAEDSWGRFWGWDPKENGALLICLSQIALLHARMSGMVKQFGFNLWAGATGLVVAFSWFHTNLLGIGLHNYGFDPDLKRALFWYYGIASSVLLISAAGYIVREQMGRDDAVASRAAVATATDKGSEAAPAK